MPAQLTAELTCDPGRMSRRVEVSARAEGRIQPAACHCTSVNHLSAKRRRREVKRGSDIVLAGDISRREDGVRTELRGDGGTVAVRQVREHHAAAVAHDVSRGGTAEPGQKQQSRPSRRQ